MSYFRILIKNRLGKFLFIALYTLISTILWHWMLVWILSEMSGVVPSNFFNKFYQINVSKFLLNKSFEVALPRQLVPLGMCNNPTTYHGGHFPHKNLTNFIWVTLSFLVLGGTFLKYFTNIYMGGIFWFYHGWHFPMGGTFMVLHITPGKYRKRRCL